MLRSGPGAYLERIAQVGQVVSAGTDQPKSLNSELVTLSRDKQGRKDAIVGPSHLSTVRDIPVTSSLLDRPWHIPEVAGR